MDIRDIEELLSNSEIEEGEYNQIRFEVSACQVTTASGTFDAELPSGKSALRRNLQLSLEM